VSPDDLAARFRAAQTVALDAGALAQGWFAGERPLDVALKGPQDVVTAADGEIERLIVEDLESWFPDDAFIGEEGGGAAAEACWVIDPIDGTANFARGLPHWCVSIALVVAERTAIGVICEPAAGSLYSAVRGGGAHCNGVRLRVSGVADPHRAMVDVGYSTRTPADAFGRLVGDLLARGLGVTQCGSAALGLARVADGRLDGYAERHLYAWDVLAGLLLVEEAGGRVNAFLRGDALARGSAAIAATPALYPLLEQAIAAH